MADDLTIRLRSDNSQPKAVRQEEIQGYKLMAREADAAMKAGADAGKRAAEDQEKLARALQVVQAKLKDASDPGRVRSLQGAVDELTRRWTSATRAAESYSRAAAGASGSRAADLVAATRGNRAAAMQNFIAFAGAGDGPTMGDRALNARLARNASTKANAGAGGGGGGNLGTGVLLLSQALEDAQYGISGVVNNIPGLILALGGGPGLAGVASLAAVAVNQLVRHWGDLEHVFQGDTARVAAQEMERFAAATQRAVEAGGEVGKIRGRDESASAGIFTRAIENSRGGGDAVLDQLVNAEVDRRKWTDLNKMTLGEGEYKARVAEVRARIAEQLRDAAGGDIGAGDTIRRLARGTDFGEQLERASPRAEARRDRARAMNDAAREAGIRIARARRGAGEQLAADMEGRDGGAHLLRGDFTREDFEDQARKLGITNKAQVTALGQAAYAKAAADYRQKVEKTAVELGITPEEAQGVLGRQADAMQARESAQAQHDSLRDRQASARQFRPQLLSTGAYLDSLATAGPQDTGRQQVEKLQALIKKQDDIIKAVEKGQVPRFP